MSTSDDLRPLQLQKTLTAFTTMNTAPSLQSIIACVETQFRVRCWRDFREFIDRVIHVNRAALAAFVARLEDMPDAGQRRAAIRRQARRNLSRALVDVLVTEVMAVRDQVARRYRHSEEVDDAMQDGWVALWGVLNDRIRQTDPDRAPLQDVRAYAYTVFDNCAKTALKKTARWRRLLDEVSEVLRLADPPASAENVLREHFYKALHGFDEDVRDVLTGVCSPVEYAAKFNVPLKSVYKKKSRALERTFGRMCRSLTHEGEFRLAARVAAVMESRTTGPKLSKGASHGGVN